MNQQGQQRTAIVSLVEHAGKQQEKRRQSVREYARSLADMPDAPVGCVSFMVLDTGAIETAIVNVEPEHIDSLIMAMQRAKSRMLSHLDGHREAA